MTPRSASLYRTIWLAILLLQAVVPAFPAFASDDARKNFDVPAGDAGETLKLFAHQANREIMFQAEPMNGIRTHALKGEFTVHEALVRLLAGTALHATEDIKTGALAIVRSALAGVRPPAEAPRHSSTAQTKTNANMKNYNAKSGLLAALIAFFGSAILPGQTTSPAPEEPEVVKLPQFTVTGYRADPYHPSETMSITRTAGDILSSPFSVSVITSGLLGDIGASSIFEATHFVAGVSPGRGSGTGGFEDRQNFRGFETMGKTIDNFSSTVLTTTNQGIMANIDPAFIERAELVMGPDTILSPTGTPGGSVNVITKAPKFERGSDVTIVLGNYNAQKLILDDYGPIGSSKHWAYRVIGSFQDAKTYTPGYVRQSNAEGALEYDFSPTAKIVSRFLFLKWAITGNTANAANNGMQVYTPDTVGGATISTTPQPGFHYNGWNASASWSIRPDTTYFWETVFTAALNEHINMRLAAAYLKDDLGPQCSSFYATVPSETYNAATGQVTGVSPVDPTKIPVLAYWAIQRDKNVQFQNDFAASYRLGSVSLEPVVGWSTQLCTNPLFISLLDKNVPTVNLALNDTLPFMPPLSQFKTFSYNTPSHVKLFQAYAVTRVGLFNDRVFLTGGVSRNWLQEDVYVFGGGYVPGAGQVGKSPGDPGYLTHYTLGATGNAVAPTQAPFRDTYLGGIIVKPVKSIALYGSYASNSALATGNNPLWSTGTQWEFGVKGEFYNKRILLSMAHFQIVQTNQATVNPFFNTGQSTVPYLLSNMTNHGYEFNATGGITSNLSAIGSFTAMQLRDPFGRRIRNVPDRMANLLLNYSFKTGTLKNLSAFAGVSYLGNVAGETETGVTSLGVPTQPGFYLPAWTIINAGASYKRGLYQFTLNVDNIADTKAWWQASSRLSVEPYPGITFRLTTTRHF